MAAHLPQNVGLRARVTELTGLSTGQVITIGVATVALTPIVLPVLRPVLKATIKTGVTAFEKTKQAIAETGEILADIAAEAKAEARTDSLKAVTQAGPVQSAANEN
ncbi:hypothetical protein N836_14090 [Leptolyngbya sp. Heron Island J]|uniref:DUF5132 domain-containing protein n=1 Tax=Leptolyngbya sp. Heron Island J TaxID=1385935 RepID=UPI0003B9C97B|nr:DUF5132 domain-containing protein [Leptolyngbya sp. Heron Island J]ESA34887.1 hypothetical protein N836_14090 [Leptolyngbya sp. Heron Island J]